MDRCAAGFKIPSRGKCPECGAASSEPCGVYVRQQADTIAALRAENERLTADLCKWRSAIQELTPGGSEFMSVDAVRGYAAMQKKETFDAHMGAAKARKELAQAEAQLAVAVEILEIISMHIGYTKLHPDESAPLEVQSAYSEGVTDGMENMAAFAKEKLATLPTRAKLLLDVVTAVEDHILKWGRTHKVADLSHALAAYHAEPVAQSGGGTGMGEIAKRTSRPAIE